MNADMIFAWLTGTGIVLGSILYVIAMIKFTIKMPAYIKMARSHDYEENGSLNCFVWVLELFDERARWLLPTAIVTMIVLWLPFIVIAWVAFIVIAIVYGVCWLIMEKVIKSHVIRRLIDSIKDIAQLLRKDAFLAVKEHEDA